MRFHSGNLSAAAFSVCMAVSLSVSGCAGPSTRILPRDNSSQYENVPEEVSLLEEANPFYIQETLTLLTASERSAGSRGEREAARRLQQLLHDYGYEVIRQRFREWDGKTTNEVTGTNVVAVRKAHSEEADILIIGTHHDTAFGSPGANDNAAAVAAWLETARLVSRMATDTEIRFVSFSGTEDGWLGSRYYVDSLTRKERDRVIGVIQLDAFGYAEFPEIVLGTRGGEATMLGDHLKKSCWNVLGETWQYEAREESDLMSFVSGQIPAVSMTQKRKGYETGTPLDLADTVDVERVARLTDVITQTVAQIISTDSPSMLAKSRFMNHLKDSAYIQQKESLPGFGSDRASVERNLHMQGIPVSSHSDQDGRTMEDYQYQMKWYDVDQIILTNYYYVDGRLDSITLDADGAGVELEDMKERLESWYGVPEREEAVPDGTAYEWTDRMRRLNAVLTPNADGFDVELTGIQPETWIFKRFTPDGACTWENEEIWTSVLGSAAAHADILMNKIQSILPEQEAELDSIVLYTDGLGASEGYLEPVESAGEAEELSRSCLYVDLEDALYPDGSWRDETATEKLILRLYGTLLEQSGAGIAGQFQAEFALREQESEEDVRIGVKPGEQNGREPELPDFAESLMLFVLSMKPDMQPGDWNERISFFYDQDEMVSYRKQVRSRLGLPITD